MDYLDQRFSNHVSPRLRGWIEKACKLQHIKEKDMRIRAFKSDERFLREHYEFKTKIKKSELDSW